MVKKKGIYTGKNKYRRDYFERGIETGKSLYSNYHWMPELTIPMASVIIDYLNIKRGQRVLDIGCAKGYLVKALRWLGREAYGYDISDYALAKADHEIKSHLFKRLPIPDDPYHFAVAKDTFEHVRLRELRKLLTNLRAGVLFVIVPLGDGKKYNVPSYELDITHIHRQPLEWWNQLLKDHGWKIRSSVPKVSGLKDNWAYMDFANGFIVAENPRYMLSTIESSNGYY